MLAHLKILNTRGKNLEDTERNGKKLEETGRKNVTQKGLKKCFINMSNQNVSTNVPLKRLIKLSPTCDNKTCNKGSSSDAPKIGIET